ncbi:MAG: 3-methyl-2-oxobutanoate dehydrogenase subunit VorB [Ardenticatenaceae bacterium]|nr:3-methyl-2-oxobutanoate dehydrogenase subunit VorB [Anaerolineales bacterium]MCB8923893.1 3-methyl-2-oxobutanoate dehydrogenase subunit VorB [Ardenticatenaceae bacterium]MCB8990462.1 3-methyl-2-oxobutanoate dehydrogenase subunit VorB [Ardenticatenaceae bacterium]MCB9003476.1 3-methyl-2-oxobutanoate dehydrogenase subunit VorB [Ardenticatenaceae bacterium]
MTKELLKGNVAIAEAAVRAGCEAYFGYPITPQTELLEHMSSRMIELGRTFLQAESEVAAINMVYGAAAAGARVMTSSSSPGISLMQEGISYIAGSEVPVVIVDVIRGGPGLGNIQPSQGDYNQVTKSAGHGDFHPIVLAPSTIQEAIDMMGLAFDLADKYRTLVFVVADGSLGQMMEPAELPPMQELRPRPTWSLTGKKDREQNLISSIYLGASLLEEFNRKLQAKLAIIEKNEVRYEAYELEDAEYVVVAFGTAARVAKTAVQTLRRQGIPVGLFRPISLWPFPEQQLTDLADNGRVKGFLVTEMNAGQMLHDVRLAVGRGLPVKFYGRMGGAIPMPEEIETQILNLINPAAQPETTPEGSNGYINR